MRKTLIMLLSALALMSCGKKAAVVQRPAFSSDSAYVYIQRQMNFGPRVPNSKAHNDCAIWLIQQLRAFGAKVELQRGQMPDFRGNMQEIYNIIAHFSTPAIANRPRILLGAHYDTRPWCDEEEDYVDRYYNVPGANDGASGVGVLMEVARQIGMRLADSCLTTPVDIVLFVVEDSGTPRFYTGIEREDTWCLGSQLWGKQYAQQITNNQSSITNDKVAITGDHCTVCLACVHACPQQAMTTHGHDTLKERQYRNPQIKLKDLLMR